MPVVPVELDAERYDELTTELVSRVLAHNPEWTDVNAGDPGVPLVELLAFLSDSLLTRDANPLLRRVLSPPRARERASVRLAPLEPARAVLRICRRRFLVLRRWDELELIRARA